MSINDPQWGNSHRPEQKEPDQAPENAGAAPVQPESERQDVPPSGNTGSPSGKPPEGPPDLEVLWQQLVYRIRCRLAAMLRREAPPPPESVEVIGSSSTVNASDSAAVPNWQALTWQSWLIGVSLLFGAWLMSGFYLVDANQRGVITRLGVIAETTEPGWHWRWPYPFESVRLVNVTGERILEVGTAVTPSQLPGLMLTADQNLLSVSYGVVYQVTDPIAYLTRVDQPSDVLGVLSESVLRDVVAGQTFATLQASVTKPGEVPTSQGPLMATARGQVQQRLDAIDAGIQVKEVLIRDLRLPSPVLQAIKQADQDAQTNLQSFRESQIAATDGLIKSYKLASQLQSESQGYAQMVDATIARFNATPAPDLATAQAQVSELTQAAQGQFPLLFERVADLTARTSQPNKGLVKRTTPAAGANELSSPVPGAWRDRDIMRNRDRVDRPGSGS